MSMWRASKPTAHNIWPNIAVVILDAMITHNVVWVFECSRQASSVKSKRFHISIALLPSIYMKIIQLCDMPLHTFAINFVVSISITALFV